MQAVDGRPRPRGRRRRDQDLPGHRAAARGELQPRHVTKSCCSAASPTTSPAPPTSPTTWCAAACARCRPSACRRRRWPSDVRCRRRRAQVAHHPAAEAVAQSLAALRWLQAQGAPQIYFKYCSTFDSTPHGNIGPVTEALMDALGTRLHDRLPGISRQPAAPSSRATCSSATCCCARAACGTIR